MATSLPQSLDWDKARTVWAQAIQPVLSNAIVQGVAVNGVMFAANTALTISHGLGRTPQGFFITDINAAANVYRTAAFNASTITLEASAKATVNLWVF